MQRRILRRFVPAVLAAATLAGGYIGLTANGSGASDPLHFDMVRSTAAATAGCLPNAKGTVQVTQMGVNQRMRVRVANLPPNTDFDFFVLQLPDKPFGVAWYQSDLHTDDTGHGSILVEGIFNEETFSISQGGPANGSDPTQNVTGPAVKDTNVVFRGTHQYHLGLWFNSPDDANKAHCGSGVTPFNGEQHAGVQVLSTRNFAPDHGPLEAIK
jgi:hypothetical protein